jgi:hypothetical protein
VHKSFVAESNKKADMVERPQAFDHIGLLVDWSAGTARLPFI